MGKQEDISPSLYFTTGPHLCLCIMETPHCKNPILSKSRRLKDHGLRVRVDIQVPPEHIIPDPQRLFLQCPHGAKVKCHACDRQLNNPFFIACNNCDDWFHFMCVVNSVDPSSRDWYCSSCISAYHSFAWLTDVLNCNVKRED